jgi:hypothetical protein
MAMSSSTSPWEIFRMIKSTKSAKKAHHHAHNCYMATKPIFDDYHPKQKTYAKNMKSEPLNTKFSNFSFYEILNVNSKKIFVNP